MADNVGVEWLHPGNEDSHAKGARDPRRWILLVIGD